jgi:hypothetical protein
MFAETVNRTYPPTVGDRPAREGGGAGLRGITNSVPCWTGLSGARPFILAIASIVTPYVAAILASESPVRNR